MADDSDDSVETPLGTERVYTALSPEARPISMLPYPIHMSRHMSIRMSTHGTRRARFGMVVDSVPVHAITLGAIERAFLRLPQTTAKPLHPSLSISFSSKIQASPARPCQEISGSHGDILSIPHEPHNPGSIRPSCRMGLFRVSDKYRWTISNLGHLYLDR